uniref:Uncharacterized protein n=1 Tax=Timema genevievae TaxID=629358 RepID=A0A7R9PPL4_TIMGE|nr:unnamed protein product [Timema genevievae]
MIKLSVVTAVLVALCCDVSAGGHAHSSTYFKGPVVGPAQEVVVSSGHGGQGGHGGHDGGHDGGHGHVVDYVPQTLFKHLTNLSRVQLIDKIVYVVLPEAHPKYEFGYEVTDHHTGDSHYQKESRDGDKVVGEYALKEPGGNVRTVKYVADKHGFHPVVHNSHVSLSSMSTRTPYTSIVDPAPANINYSLHYTYYTSSPTADYMTHSELSTRTHGDPGAT